MDQELIDMINQIDTAHYVTYIYGCFFVIALLFLIYCVLAIVFSLRIKKLRNYYKEKLTKEEENKINKYMNINIFTTKKELDK